MRQLHCYFDHAQTVAHSYDFRHRGLILRLLGLTILCCLLLLLAFLVVNGPSEDGTDGPPHAIRGNRPGGVAGEVKDEHVVVLVERL